MKLKELMTKEELLNEGFKQTNCPDVLYVIEDEKRIFYKKIENSDKYSKTNVSSALNIEDKSRV